VDSYTESKITESEKARAQALEAILKYDKMQKARKSQNEIID